MALMTCEILWRWLSLVAEMMKEKKIKKKCKNNISNRLQGHTLPSDITPYSFGGESVNEKAIVAFPLSMEMLFGLSRSVWTLLLSDFDEKTISGWIAFVVVSLTRDAVKWTIIGEHKRDRDGEIYRTLI